MFRDERQGSRAILALLKPAGLDRLWSVDGPSDEACRIVDQKGGTLSGRDRVLVLAAFAFWRGRGGVTLDDAVAALDADHAERLCSLWIARSRGAHAADAWVAREEARQARVGDARQARVGDASGRDDFLILSLKHTTGSLCRWWGPENAHYVERLDEAGHYSAAAVAAQPGYYDDGTATCTVPAEMAEAYSRTVQPQKLAERDMKPRPSGAPARVVDMRLLEVLRTKKPRGAEVVEATLRCLRDGDILGAELRLSLILRQTCRARGTGKESNP